MDNTIVVNGVEYVRKVATSSRVLVRCRNAGVHVGTLERRSAGEVVLLNANRVWRWRGANTLSEVAMNGVIRSEYTRIAVEVPYIILTESDVCEVIPVAEGVNLTEVWNV